MIRKLTISILILYFSLVSSAPANEEENTESSFGGFYLNVRNLFGTAASNDDSEQMSNTSGNETISPSQATDNAGAYSYVPSLPLFNQDLSVNITFDTSKLSNAISTITDVGKATLKAPFHAYSAIKNVTLESRSEGNDTSPGIIELAKSLPVINQVGSKINDLKNRIQFIKPGTKWCGTGDIARDFDDTGIFHDIDSCCRDHDLCPENIIAQSSKYNLTNDGSFTRSSCNCDFQFYKCLKEISNPVAYEVGIAYFDILKPLCFKFDFPKIGCKKFFGETEQCAEFEFDLTKQKQYQWFPSPSFAL